ncbi:MAG: hypothetical protein AB2715_08425 [Candidatus Thiodiazotropha sp.]
MPDFDWRSFEDVNITERFNAEALGYGDWIEMLRQLMADLEAFGGAWYERLETQVLNDLFTGFLDATGRLSRSPRVCRVFISHQQKDVGDAVKIAAIARSRGFEYWLDVHDPTLRFMGTTNLPPSLKAFLIASIVEMNLLNCSHVCSVQTVNAVTSRWVPYEFGRAKSRQIHSSQAASWFAPGAYPTTAEYLLLGECLHSNKTVELWLDRERSRLNCR